MINVLMQHSHRIDYFWQLVDMTKASEKYKIDKNLQYLEFAPLETLKKIFIQYRFFTHYYIADLAILISKIPFGQLRSILAEILNEELGNGKAQESHPELYDNFLKSLGISTQALQFGLSHCSANLAKIQNSLLQHEWTYGLGLRGMGGECLCQIYLSTMYDFFIKNPAIIELREQLAWSFWEIHIGEIDLHHQQIMRNAINNLLHDYPQAIDDLTNGYLESKNAWDQFWEKIFSVAKNETQDVNYSDYKECKTQC